MRRLDTRKAPQPGELWLSRPPYLLIAHIVEIDELSEPPVVGYELHDEEGSVLEQVNHAVVDGGWWHAFQPLTRLYG